MAIPMWVSCGGSLGKPKWVGYVNAHMGITWGQTGRTQVGINAHYGWHPKTKIQLKPIEYQLKFQLVSMGFNWSQWVSIGFNWYKLIPIETNWQMSQWVQLGQARPIETNWQMSQLVQLGQARPIETN